MPNVSLSVSGTQTAVQLGGGIDVNVSPHFGFRGELDLRGVTTDNANVSGRQWRFVGAIAIRP